MINIKFEKENNKSVAYDNETKIGECAFIEDGKVWNIVHTEVNSKYQGQGIARKLVENVIENAHKNNKQKRRKSNENDRRNCCRKTNGIST